MLNSLAASERRLLGKQLVERRPVDVFHGDVGQLALLLDVVDGDDSGMREHAGRAGLAEEPLAQALLLFRLAAAAELDGLDGDGAADVGVDGVIDHAHGAAAQFPDDFVSPDAIHSV